MKEIKGFQQPDAKGNDMWDGYKDGPWQLYERGPSCRIGRKRWWGIQWFRSLDFVGGFFIFQTQSRTDAEAKLKEKNKELKDKEWYKDSKWEAK